jgi:3-oxoacyl-ACP reductase-like protein
VKNFLSILSATIATTLIATSFSPAQAFTWDDLWGVVKQGVVKSLQESPPPQAASAQESPASSSDTSNNSNNTSPPQSDESVESAPAE